MSLEPALIDRSCVLQVKKMLYYNEGLDAVGRERCPPHIKQAAWLK